MTCAFFPVLLSLIYVFIRLDLSQFFSFPSLSLLFLFRDLYHHPVLLPHVLTLSHSFINFFPFTLFFFLDSFLFYPTVIFFAFTFPFPLPSYFIYLFVFLSPLFCSSRFLLTFTCLLFFFFFFFCMVLFSLSFLVFNQLF